MDKKRIQIIATAVLAIIFILVWANAFKVFKSKAATKAPAAPAITPPSIPFKAKQESSAETPKKEESKETLGWGRCPFSGKVYTSRQEGPVSLKLSGIIWDSKNPLAMINERVVKVGDTIAGNTVVEIKHDRVILNNGSSDFELK